MDRWWFLTWTTYGTWLPGDPRGSVTSVRVTAGSRREQDQPGTPYEEKMPGLHAAAQALLKGPPIYLRSDQAKVLLQQFQETAVYRGWQLEAVAIMSQHVHLVVGVSGDPDPATLVRDFKAHGSRALNRHWPRPASATWWAAGGGSRRKLPDEQAILCAIEYVRRQAHPLVIWIQPPS